MPSARATWTVLAVALLAFAVFESVQHGWGATVVMAAFAVMPDLSLIGAFAEHGKLRPERVAAYNLLHTPWMPLALVAVGLVIAVAGLGLGDLPRLAPFLAGTAWLTHIAVDRAAGFGLRARDGSIVPVGRRATGHGRSGGGA